MPEHRTARPAMDLQFGQIYGGKYRLLRLLGTGGMGAVYEGENVEQKRRVAIKTLHKELAAHHETLKRFEREAEAASRIGSNHIARVIELGQLPDGARFMVMELLEGVTLRQRMRERGRLMCEEAVRLVCQILAGLSAAHAAGIVHRDLKPANIFLLRGADGLDFVKILDFGVSKLSDHQNQSMALTSTGMVVGTPHYMAPEQAKGSRDVDGRADLYATGVILYECLAGQVPFHASSFNELIFKIVLQPAPPVETLAPEVDPELATILAKVMAKEPVARYQSAQELHQALRDWMKRHQPTGGTPQQREPRVLSSLTEDDPLADNGTVIMRRQDNNLPYPAAPPPAAPPPAAPPPPSGPVAQGGPPPSSPMAQAPASAPRPRQPSAPVVAQAPAPAPSSQSHKLAPIVALIAFAVVFVLGGAVMLLVRSTRGSSNETAPSTSATANAAAAAPAPASSAAKATGSAVEGSTKGSDAANAPAPASPPSTSQTAGPGRSAASASPAPGKRRTISTDL
ncbi:serine/threonine-protein kinase [Polyangium aurulentum]|uniref:serine/threonine-protein kinase n=1 Tax=Polyangium aurulentum TaxID=2567896 RepID=UPI0010AE97C8|nr:serine/threonine-protein kinase [Polyangium aurulentum]UQA61226.1 protein kinase [Polyangium aurulentum]